MDMISTIERDSRGNFYIETGNLRLTWVRTQNREDAKDWAESDVIRIQAYRGQGRQLHIGAELPVESGADAKDLLEAVRTLMAEAVRTGRI
jgi:hypothetical protein